MIMQVLMVKMRCNNHFVFIRKQTLRKFKSAFMGNIIRPRPPDEYVKLLREINAIGNNINQIAHIANAEQRISESKINEVMHLQNEIMRMVRSVR